jgi:hypothetical protein
LLPTNTKWFSQKNNKPHGKTCLKTKKQKKTKKNKKKQSVGCKFGASLLQTCTPGVQL